MGRAHGLTQSEEVIVGKDKSVRESGAVHTPRHAALARGLLLSTPSKAKGRQWEFHRGLSAGCSREARSAQADANLNFRIFAICTEIAGVARHATLDHHNQHLLLRADYQRAQKLDTSAAMHLNVNLAHGTTCTVCISRSLAAAAIVTSQSTEKLLFSARNRT